ncbi:MAG: glutathione peroxidase [Ignavibacteriae bacterium]|nr:glutathione peroxidase [Ignavibacteriota bacterium]
MSIKRIISSIFSIFLSIFISSPMISEPYNGESFYDFTMKTIDGKEIKFDQYKGKAVLVVNVASFCGYTKQYTGLEQLYEKYKDKGLVVIGFPSNDYGEQEPGSDAEIKEFCATHYNVTFQMFAKITVHGEAKHPLYKFLTSGGGDEKLAGEVAWNFEKFLISRNGKIMSRYKRNIEPMSEEIVTAIERELGK